MAKTASINVRTDPETKSEADKIYSTFGLTVSDAINVFLHISIMEGGFPFEIKQPRYNKETEKAIDEARSIMNGKIIPKKYASVEQLFADLDKG